MAQHMYTPGDLLRIHGENDEDWYAEILESGGEELEVCYLEPTRDQGGRIWRFSDDSSYVRPESIRQHVKVSPITRKTVVDAWKTMGFVVDVDNFAREEDFNAGRVYLDLDKMDDGGDEKDPNEYDLNDGFVVDDDVADEPFTLADPSTLDEDAAAWVRETHAAIQKYNTWRPTDRSGIGIKYFVDNLARRASNDTNNRRWAKRLREVDFKNP